MHDMPVVQRKKVQRQVMLPRIKAAQEREPSSQVKRWATGQKERIRDRRRSSL